MPNQYPLPPFQSQDKTKLHKVIDAYPLATLISITDSDWPTITQIPVYRVEDTLIGHLDLNNPHAQVLDDFPKVTCLFSGPNHYMSPTVYPDEQYPGWNYVQVRVKANAERLTLEELRDSLLELAKRNEPADSVYELSRTQKNFDKFSQFIAGFRFQMEEVSGTFKLAQDKGAAHAELARKHLSSRVKPDPGPLLKELLN